MFKKFFIKSEFTKNVATLMTGNFFVLIIPLIISPVLTRLYSPHDFGGLALFMGVVTILSVIVGGRYEIAVMLPEKEEDAVNVFALSFLINVSISSLFLFIIILFHGLIADFFDESLSDWLYAVPATAFLINLFNSLQLFNNRIKEYKDIAKSSGIRAILLAVVQISLGIIKSGVTGLISGQIASHFFANIFLLKKILSDRSFFSNVSKRKIFEMASVYDKFPKYNVAHTLINTFFSTLPVFLLSYFFSSSVVGLYSFATRIIKMPTTLIATSIGNVLYEKIVRMYRTKSNYMHNVYKYLILQTIAGSILFLLIFLSSDYLFYIFGDKWIDIGFYIKILIPWLFMVFIVSPLAFSINMTFNQKEGLFIELVYGGIKLVSLLVGGYMKSVVLTLGLFSFGNCIFLFFQCLWFINLLKKGEFDT